MAGIEKICEVCGEHCGGDMYDYKRNSIQVCPKCRKGFRGKHHTLIVKEEGERHVWKYGGSMKAFEKPYEDWQELTIKGSRRVKEYMITLIVPELQGNVNSRYVNWTCDLATTKRKLKRLLRCRELNIEYKELL